MLDEAARSPEDADCPTAHFLLESKRGPDYQFATAAALLLRSLDYPTRLVGGFYVSPDRYDRLKGHTPVVGADAHVWVEVNHAGRNWLTVEPTPGYEVLGPPPTWWQQALAWCWHAGRWIVAHWTLCLSVGGCLAVAWRQRVWCLDRLAVAVWHYAPVRCPRARILQTARLVDLRLWLAGCARLPGETWANAFHRLADRSPHLRRVGIAFAAIADWAIFAPHMEPVPEQSDMSWHEACRHLAFADLATNANRRSL